MSKTLLETIKFNYTMAADQSDLFTPNHEKYSCVIRHNGRQYTTTYQCNPSATHEPTLNDVLYCLLLDASSYDCAIDVDDFLIEFGYTDSLENVRKGEKAYKACGRTSKALDRLFTTEEREELEKHFENY